MTGNIIIIGNKTKTILLYNYIIITEGKKQDCNYYYYYHYFEKKNSTKINKYYHIWFKFLTCLRKPEPMCKMNKQTLFDI